MSILGDLARKYTKVAKPIVDKLPGVKWVGINGTNFFTGVRVTRPVAAVAAAGILGAAAIKPTYDIASGRESSRRAAAAANGVNVGPIAATQFESTGVRSNLGATGDLVFGLNNKRRG
jgi:hypothetical protein